MHGIVLITVLVVVYFIGRAHQAYRYRTKNAVGYHIGKVYDAMKDKNK